MNLLNLTVLAATVSAYGADAITGRVLNASSAALTDARVWLKSRPDVADSTGADGRFSLTLNPTALTPFSGGVSGLPTFRFYAEGLIVSLQREQDIGLELRNAQGRMAASLFKGRLEKGENSIPLGREVLKLLSGAYYLAFTGEQTAGSLPIRGSFRMAKSAAEGDTLIVLRMGHEIRKLPLADLSARDVGDVSLKLRTYRKDTAVAVKALRRIEVFVPSDYRELYRLPVLYLIHGAGDNEVYWREKGHLLDSLNTFSDREKVQPMIIVTPSAGGAPGVGAYGKTGDPFVPDLAVDIRKYVESHYKADTSRWARGISGLSAGAAQTWMLTLFYPELWGWSLPMSGGLGRSTGYTPEKLKADVASKVVDVAVLNQMKLFKEYSNPSDLALMDTQTTIKFIESLGIKIATDYTTRTSGGHAPVFWNEVFRKYAPLLFKE